MGVHRSVRFRATNAQVIAGVLPLVATWLLVLGLLVRFGTSAADLGFLVLLAAASCTAAAALLLWRGTEVTGDGIVLRNDLVTRVPWSEVHAVRVVRRLGTRQLVVETERRVHRATAPTASVLVVDPHFDAKAAFVQRWWLACAPPEVRQRAQADGAVTWGQPISPVVPAAARHGRRS